MNRLWYIIPVVFLAGCSKQDTPPSQAPYGIPENDEKRISIIHDDVEGLPVVVAGSPGYGFIVSFVNDIDGTHGIFEPVEGKIPVIMQDRSGSQWDITGKSVSGPHKGKQLPLTHAFMGYWFSWGTFYPGAEIYEGEAPADTGSPYYLQGDYLVPQDQILDGGPGKDGIPALETPELISNSQTGFLFPDDRVLGMVINGEARAYPVMILDYHEIINDGINGFNYAVTYCPLTGTGIAWTREISGSLTTFGVSGLLYNSNLIPYDRATDSYWSQIRRDGIHGEHLGDRLEQIFLLDVPWKTWQDMYPGGKVVSTNTGYKRKYQRYPYGNYRENDELIFPVEILDKRLHAKEYVHGIIVNDKAKIYRFASF